MQHCKEIFVLKNGMYVISSRHGTVLTLHSLIPVPKINITSK